MELTFFSLLYPSEQSQKDHFSGKYKIAVSNQIKQRYQV